MIIHFNYFHELLGQYIICTDSNGNSAIENVADLSDCNDCSSKENTKNNDVGFSQLNKDGCTDISLHGECSENDQTSINQVNFKLAIVLSTTTSYSLNENASKEYDTPINEDLSYVKIFNITTVTLLI